MPSNSETALRYRQEESSIAEALESVRGQSTPDILQLARKFHVPYGRLRDRYRGKLSRSTRQSAGRKLTDQQQSEILSEGYHLDTHGIKKIANEILKRDHIGNSHPPTVSDKWCQRFIKIYGKHSKDISYGNASRIVFEPLNAEPAISVLGSATEASSTHPICPIDTFDETADDRQVGYHNSGSPTESLQTLVPASATLGEQGFVDQTHLPSQQPRIPTIERQSTRAFQFNAQWAEAFTSSQNRFAFQPSRDDDRVFFPDPHSPSPPRPFLISENIFLNVRAYFETCCQHMTFDADENLIDSAGTKLDNALCSKFDSYCFTATIFIQKGLQVQFGRALSDAFSLVKEIIRTEHPRTLTCFLEVLIHFTQTGLSDVASKLCSYIGKMAASIGKREDPWGRICGLLGELDLKSLDQAMAQIWRCTTDTFDSRLPPLNRLAVAVRLDYIKRVVTDQLDEGRLLHDLFARVRGIPIPATPRVMLNLAHNLNKQGRHGQAEELAREVCSLLQNYEIYTLRIVEKIECLKIISHSQFSQGRFDKAERTMRQAIQMIVEQLGLQHPWVTEFNIVLDGWLRNSRPGEGR